MIKLKKITAAVLILPIICLVYFAFQGCSFTEYEKRQAYVFGGIMPFEFWGHGKNVDKAFNEMLQVMDKIDTLTNINREGSSDVLSINLAGAGEETEIDFITYDIIRLAKEFYTDTDGTFNIASYPLLYLWGIDAYGFTDYQYDKEYKETDKWAQPASFAKSDIKRKLPLPDYSEVLRVKEFCDLDYLQVFERGGKYYAIKQINELMIDLGGISKGYAADLCVKICGKYNITSAKIDLSGNLFFIGSYLDKSDWNVGISTPAGFNTLDDGDDYFCAVGIKNASAVTSGDYQRYRAVSQGETEIIIPHIINGKTGLPYTLVYDGEKYKNINGGVVSCTVIGNNSVFSDAYATAACVMGIENARDFLTQKGIKSIIFTSNKRAAFTNGAEPVLTDVYQVYKDYKEV